MAILEWPSSFDSRVTMPGGLVPFRSGTVKLMLDRPPLGESIVPAPPPTAEPAAPAGGSAESPGLWSGLSKFVTDILPAAAARTSYEIARPAVERSGPEGMFGKVATVGVELNVSRNVKLAAAAAALALLLVVLIVARKKRGR